MIPFQSTVWAEINRARDRDPTAYLEFVNRYRPAVVSFLRSQGIPPDDCEDLTQDVFLYIVRGDVLSKVDPAKGRFRNLILAVTRNVVLNNYRHKSAMKRGGKQPTLSLDETNLPAEAKEETETFDKMWAQQLVANALRELSRANPQYYRAIKLLLDGMTHKEIAESMDKSSTEVNNYIHRAKSWISRTVQREIAEYCVSDQDYKTELEHLSKYISRDEG